MQAKDLVASIDQSTTSTKFSVFRHSGQLVDQAIIEHKQIVPKEGWLEHDPNQIMNNVKLSIEQTITKLRGKGLSEGSIVGVGVANQRETVVAWDAETGRPLYNAIVWCDNRTTGIAERWSEKHGDMKSRVGLVASSYFSLFKILWLIENVPEVKEKLEQKKVRFGTIDTWVVYNLTGRYVTDASNASRTFLYNLKGYWDEQILKLAGLHKECLPQVIGSFDKVGPFTVTPLKQLKDLTICSILGDQQSSAYALNLNQGQVKCTYGTGCFMMMDIGDKPTIFKDYITTIMYKDGEHIEYGIEASVEAGGGLINWLKSINFFESYSQLNNLESNGGVIFYPTFGRIYSPYWQNNMTGGFIGLSLFTKKQHMLRAVLESIAYRVHDNLHSKELPQIKSFRADGGITNNPIIMQLQADLMGKDVIICQLDTCWGVAKGVLKSLNLPIKQIDGKLKVYSPQSARQAQAASEYQRWTQSKSRFSKYP